MTKFLSYTIQAAAAVALTFCAASCEDEDTQDNLGNWVSLDADYPGVARGGAVGFQMKIDGVDYAFIGTGANTNKTEERERFRDFYMVTWNQTEKLPVWTAGYDKLSQEDKEKVACRDGFKVAVASMPDEAPARNSGVGFALNLGGEEGWRGYVGLGFDGINYLKDFWEYNPYTNSWRQIADYPGDSVRYAVAFVIDNKAYVGTGEDFDNNYLGDFHSFDGTKWDSSVKNIGKPRAQATAFVWNGYGYVFGGTNGQPVDFFQRYNPRTNEWEDLARLKDGTDYMFDDDYLGLPAIGAASFVLYPEPTAYKYSGTPRAFVTTGGNAQGGKGRYTWEYNLIFDYWIRKTNFEGSDRKFAVPFVLETSYGRQIPFIATGSDGDMKQSGAGGSFYKDVWLFNPYQAYEQKD